VSAEEVTVKATSNDRGVEKWFQKLYGKIMSLPKGTALKEMLCK
jgi:hypothetical protein